MNADKKSAVSSQQSTVSIFTLIFLNLAIVLPLAFFLNIWVDEASTLYTTQNGFLAAFQNALKDEKQAPLYFWTLSLWRGINDSIFFARLFSIVCSLLAIKFFNDLARKFFDEKAAVLVTAFFAFHPYLIWASLEIRVYSLVILLTILLLKFFHDGHFETKEISHAQLQNWQKKPQILYVLISIVALYTNYYLGFLLIGNFFALLVLRRWKAAKNYFLQMIIVGAAFLPLIWAVKSQFAVNTSGFQTEKSLMEGLRIIWNFVLTFVLPTEIFPPEETTAISVFRVWLVRVAVLAIVILLIKNRRKLNDNIVAFGTAAATIGAFLLAAYFLLGVSYVQIRHAAVLFAPLFLCAALILSEILSPKRADARKKEKRLATRKISTVFLAVFAAVFFSYSVYTLYPNLTKRGDWARVGLFLEQNETPNQPIIVFTTFDALALPYHYQGANRILPDEKFFDWELEAEPRSADAWRRQTDFVISKIPAEAKEIWLLTNEKFDAGQACLPLENFVEANYTIVQEKKFYKETVRLLRKK